MIDFAKEEKTFDDIIAKFESDLVNFRVGRIHISLVENIMVDSYGAKVSLSHVASLSSPDPRSIIVKPWDKTLLPAVQRALEMANLGAAIFAEKDQVRFSFSSLTEEKRKESVKNLGKKTEETRISVRIARDDIWKTIQEEHKSNAISENQKFSQKQKMEKIVEQINEKIAGLAEKKEKEIMEV